MDPVPSTQTDRRSTPRARRQRRAWWVGILASLTLHVAVLLLWRTASPGGPAIAMSSQLGSFEVGRSIRAVQVVSADPTPAVQPPPRPVAAVEAPDLGTSLTGRPRLAVNLPSAEPGAPARVSAADPNRVLPSGGGANLPPMPRSILPRWVVPKSVEGLEINVRVFVTSGGRAVGTVEFDPPTPDSRFNQRIADQVRRIDYRPAIVSGRPTAGWAEITFVFCPTTVTATSPPARNPVRRACDAPAGRESSGS